MVMLLRRQLHQERPRNTPWVRTRQRGGRTVVARDWRALMRTPATRVVRVIALTMGATAAAVGAWNGTTALIVVAGLCSFLIGLEVLEPLAQEIDRCTVLDLAPVSKGEILSRHLIVPSLVAAALSTAAAVCVVPFTLAGQSRSVVVAVAVVAPFAALAGAAVNVLRDGSGPGAQAIDQLMLPPEAVGMRLLYRLAPRLHRSRTGAPTDGQAEAEAPDGPGSRPRDPGAHEVLRRPRPLARSTSPCGSTSSTSHASTVSWTGSSAVEVCSSGSASSTEPTSSLSATAADTSRSSTTQTAASPSTMAAWSTTVTQNEAPSHRSPADRTGWSRPAVVQWTP